MNRSTLLALAILAASAACAASVPAAPGVSRPAFENVTVHDPMVVRADGTFYIFGSHLAVARSEDLQAWRMVASGVRDSNRVIPGVTREMREALEWGQSETFWAGCVIQLADGRFYFYYSVCRGDAPRAALGLAVADQVEGPYRHVEILLRSGMWGEPSEDGRIYDANIHPNAIDPHVFFDGEGRLWMVYGSYSGGIFILSMDEQTGRPLPEQGYGKKLLGGNHSRIEAPYILHNPETGFYYLFLSYGGLDSTGGYQIRVARSRAPDGPYHDPQGNAMIDARGPAGSFFDDRAIEPFGGKLIGNFRWTAPAVDDAPEPEDRILRSRGYVSPGHNSAHIDPESGRAVIIFHSRFPDLGEWHQVRVHPLLFNAQGWPVIAPHRYAGERPAPVPAAAVAGEYQWIHHGRSITADVTPAGRVRLAADGTVEGDATGTWEMTGPQTITLTLAGTQYEGVVLAQWDPWLGRPVLTFSALSAEGTSIWGSGIAPAEAPNP